MKVSDLKLNPDNPRLIKDASFDKLKKSIKEFPQMMELRPIVVDENNVVLGGNMRLQAIKDLKMTTIPDGWVKRADELTDEQKREFVIKDNSGFGEWDWDAIANEWDDLPLSDWGLEVPTFEDVTLDAKEEDEEQVAETISKAKELQEKWQTAQGQLWKLGEHRLLCGDSTKAEDVARLIAGELVSLVVTDPPYGVSYADKNKFLNSVDKGNRVQTEIQNDHLSKEQTQEMWRAAFAQMSAIMKPGAAIYCFMPQGGDQMMMMMMMMMGAGIEPRHELIWLKNNHVLGRSDYQYKHEPILYAWKDGGHKFYGGFQTSVIECARPQSSKEHPTMKPLELIAKLVQNSSLQDEGLYEPFCGSGTTILACEQLGRKCRAIEIAPEYVAVSLQRWADYTGKTPELIDG